MLKVKGVKCNRCGDFIYSRAGHDFHRCTCKAVAVDGGFDYLRVLGNGKDFNYIEVVLDVSKEELYDDWNEHQDKYGLIKNFKSVDMNRYCNKAKFFYSAITDKPIYPIHTAEEEFNWETNEV